MARRTAVALLALLVVGLFVASVQAAVTFRSQSTLTTSVGAPLAEFAAGTGASRNPFVSDFALSANKTSFTGTMVGRAGGAVYVRDVADLVSRDASSRTVTLRATQVTNAKVTELTWTVRNGTTTVATLDVRSATPTASFTLPAGSTYALDLRATLLPGAGHNDADVALGTGVSVR